MNNIHPVHQTHDGFFNTSSGKKISLHDPQEKDITIQDIAHALSHICRFGGHTKEFYSVAQHSLLVMYLAPDELKFPALMHDAAEAYCHDIIKPLKVMLGQSYAEVEKRFEVVIAKKYFLLPEHLKAVKIFDMQALEIEHKRLIIGDGIELENYIGCRPGLRWDMVREHFIKAFWKYAPDEYCLS